MSQGESDPAPPSDEPMVACRHCNQPVGVVTIGHWTGLVDHGLLRLTDRAGGQRVGLQVHRCGGGEIERRAVPRTGPRGQVF